jgi:hypothetical protein
MPTTRADRKLDRELVMRKPPEDCRATEREVRPAAIAVALDLATKSKRRGACTLLWMEPLKPSPPDAHDSLQT